VNDEDHVVPTDNNKYGLQKYCWNMQNVPSEGSKMKIRSKIFCSLAVSTLIVSVKKRNKLKT